MKVQRNHPEKDATGRICWGPLPKSTKLRCFGVQGELKGESEEGSALSLAGSSDCESVVTVGQK